jgi:hypothetical protein
MEVAWCSDHGLPHSSLLEWDGDDRAKLVAHLLESSRKCQSCGTSDWEWNPADGGDRFAYEAAVHFCQGCLVKAGAQEDAPTGEGNTIVLIPRSVAEARRAAVEG